jgi:hypothetical protein
MSYIILVNEIHGKIYKIMIINKLRKYKTINKLKSKTKIE